MPLSIRQHAQYEGQDYWKWGVRLDGTPEELDAVHHVMYILHPTFNKPVREIYDRTSNFSMETGGWGTFTLLAKVVFKDGHDEVLKHDLELAYPDKTPAPA